MTTFFEWIDVTPMAYLACCVAILAATVTHRITGQAFGLVCAPLIALAAPKHIPAVVLLCGLPVMIYGVVGTVADIRWNEISFAFTGRIIGSVAAAVLISSLADENAIAALVGLSVLLGVAVSLRGFHVPITSVSLVAAGFLSGMMATLTSIGAPPMALLYQRETIQHVRSTLNAFFLCGAFVSVLVLALYHLINLSNLLLTISLLPVMGVGILLAGYMTRLVEIATLRPFILASSAFAATVLLIRAM